MRRFIVIICIAIGSILWAKEFQTEETGSALKKSIFSIETGIATDGKTGHGYSVFIKSSSFIGDSLIYYGFSSLFGSFITTQETFFETGLLLGYHNLLGPLGIDFDAFLDFIITGGRINQESAVYRGEAPAIHLGLSLGLPASSNIDGALTVAPVLRPYNMKTGEWDFSRSYFTAGFALRFKSYAEVKKLPWSNTFGENDAKEGKE